MPDYIIAYHGGKEPEGPEAGAQHMAKWKSWLSDLGDAVVDRGTPLGKSKIVSSSGVSDGSAEDNLSGFSIVTADSMDAAVEIAQACPFLEMGTLEVAEIMKME